MNSLAIILGFQITVSLVEILIFQLGAIILGFSMHFFWTNRKTPPPSTGERPVLAGSSLNPANEWRLKYVEEVESRQKAEQQLRRDLENLKDNESLLVIELEEAKKEIDRLEELVKPDTDAPPEEGYLAQLHNAHHQLQTHNQDISRLLSQIDQLKESEKKQQATLQANQELQRTIYDLRKHLFDRENELRMVRQQQVLTNDIQERLDKAYKDFSGLQSNLQKVESYIVRPEHRSFEYENLQQSFFRLSTEFDTLKLRQQSMLEENQRLSVLLADADDKLRESNFIRQQLQKKVAFLEELNNDLQLLAEQHKRLDNQLKRVSEISGMMRKQE
ncbi:MAG: hypothetical protein EOO04_21575 [Chitinophagaceae bacterium]|nr:MAG: hypothetical protein EOO04_21575 [Chitinophagaceae bacterium]